MTTAIELNLPELYTPHPGQVPFHKSQARFRVLACGRRWGKDRACLFELLRLLYRPGTGLVWQERKGLVPKVLCWVVAPTYKLTETIWGELKAFIPSSLVVGTSEVDHCLRLVGGVEVWMNTAAEPERLVGVGLDILWMTEGGLIPKEAWEVGLRPCLSSPGRAGLALINGTPKGLNWFYQMYLRGRDSQDTEVESWSYPTRANPYIQPKEIAEAQHSLPEMVFRQEYGAEFLSDVGVVFRNVDNCIKGELEEPKEGRHYVMGTDLAKHQDFTVLVVADQATRRVVAFERFSQIDWVIQKARIGGLAKNYNGAQVYLDSTGVGDPILEDLKAAGLLVTGIHFTAPEKKRLVDQLIVALEQEQVHFPQIDQLVNELHAFQYETTRAGNLRSGAPEGFYDDCVIALALCLEGLKKWSWAPVPVGKNVGIRGFNKMVIDYGHR